MTGDDAVDRPWLVDGAVVAARLGTTASTGLTAAEVAARQAGIGPNRLAAAPAVPRWRRVVSELADPLVILLLGAVAVSLVGWVIEGADGLPFDAIVIGVIVIATPSSVTCSRPEPRRPSPRSSRWRR